MALLWPLPFKNNVHGLRGVPIRQVASGYGAAEVLLFLGKLVLILPEAGPLLFVAGVLLEAAGEDVLDRIIDMSAGIVQLLVCYRGELRPLISGAVCELSRTVRPHEWSAYVIFWLACEVETPSTCGSNQSFIPVGQGADAV